MIWTTVSGKVLRNVFENKFLIKVTVSKTTAGSTHTTENLVDFGTANPRVSAGLQSSFSLKQTECIKRITLDYKHETLWLTIRLTPVTLMKQLVNKSVCRLLAFVFSNAPVREIESVNSADLTGSWGFAGTMSSASRPSGEKAWCKCKYYPSLLWWPLNTGLLLLFSENNYFWQALRPWFLWKRLFSNTFYFLKLSKCFACNGHFTVVQGGKWLVISQNF